MKDTNATCKPPTEMCGPRIFLLWGNNAAYKWTTTVLQKDFEVMEKGQELIFRKKFKVIFSLHLPKIVKVHFTSATRQDGFYMTNPLPLNTHTLHIHASETSYAWPQSSGDTFHAPLQQTREVHTANRPTRAPARARNRCFRLRQSLTHPAACLSY